LTLRRHEFDSMANEGMAIASASKIDYVNALVSLISPDRRLIRAL